MPHFLTSLLLSYFLRLSDDSVLRDSTVIIGFLIFKVPKDSIRNLFTRNFGLTELELIKVKKFGYSVTRYNFLVLIPHLTQHIYDNKL